jgi:hypothetical protein
MKSPSKGNVRLVEHLKDILSDGHLQRGGGAAASEFKAVIIFSCDQNADGKLNTWINSDPSLAINEKQLLLSLLEEAKHVVKTTDIDRDPRDVH